MTGGVPLGRALARADALRDARRFDEAAAAYRAALDRAPERADLWVQLGNMLKDSGRFDEAEAAYRQALALRPCEADTHLQLGRAQHLAGRRPDALRSFIEALRVSPADATVIAELASLGAGWEAGRQKLLGPRLLTDLLDLAEEMRDTLRRIESELPLVRSLVTLPAEQHDLRRRTFAAPPPPVPAPDFRLAVVIAGDGPLVELLEVLASMRRQSHRNFSVAMPDLTGEGRLAFARMAAANPVRFIDSVRSRDGALAVLVDAMPPHDGVVLSDIPMVLASEALAWMAAGLAEGEATAFPDEDVVHLGGARPIYSRPEAKAEFDAELLEQGKRHGLIAAIGRAPFQRALIASGRRAKTLAELFPALAGEGPGRPLRQFLASRPHRIAMPLPVSAARVSPTVVGSTRDIAVVIPTRDRAELLANCLTALEATAAQRERVKVVVVDNGSREAETQDLLAAGTASDRFTVTRIEEPFNWSRLNRLGTAVTTAPLLLFLNNDVDLLTPGWDAKLDALLGRTEVGVVGAKLLYPNGTIQHAGIAVGLGVHADHLGRGAPSDAEGPFGRAMARRSVTGVTGAFLATRRDLFDRLGGFDDEGLPLWFNDLDYCLKVWQAGLRVVVEPTIKAIHHESQTLAPIDSVRDAHFEAAARLMKERWGEAMTRDRWFRTEHLG